MKRIVLIAVCLSLTLATVGCHHYQRETCHLNTFADRQLMVELPTNLVEIGFEKDDFGCNDIFYDDDDASRTGAVITVHVSLTPAEGFEAACVEARESTLAGYSTETTEPQLNKDRTVCHFTQSGRLSKTPISGKTMVRITPEHPELVVTVSGLWGLKHQKLMSKAFDRFAKGVSIQAKPTE